MFLTKSWKFTELESNRGWHLQTFVDELYVPKFLSYIHKLFFKGLRSTQSGVTSQRFDKNTRFSNDKLLFVHKTTTCIQGLN